MTRKVGHDSGDVEAEVADFSADGGELWTY
jgi:hypothetical protein